MEIISNRYNPGLKLSQEWKETVTRSCLLDVIWFVFFVLHIYNNNNYNYNVIVSNDNNYTY